MDARLERTLVVIARQYAPLIVGSGWRQPGDFVRPLPQLARELASAGVLVVVGEVLSAYTDQSAAYYRVWTDQYLQLYRLLCNRLFPSYMEVTAFQLDVEDPAIVGIHGQVIPVIEVLAGYIAPYIVARQGARTISEVEVTGIMEAIFDELHADSLNTDMRLTLRRETAAHLRAMLAAPVRQIALTPLKRTIFFTEEPPAAAPSAIHQTTSVNAETPRIIDQTFDSLETMRQLAAPPDASTPVEAFTPVTPPTIELPLPPDSLPEDVPAAPPFNPRSVPVFYKREDEGKRKPRPPVPGLPRRGE